MDPFKLILLSAWHEQGGNVLQRFLDGHPQLKVYPFESQIATPLSSNLLAGPNHMVPQRYAYPVFDSEVTPEQAYAQFWDEELKTLLRAPSRSKFRDCGLEMKERTRVARFVEVCDQLAWLRTGDDAGRGVATRRDYVEAFFCSTFDAWSNFALTGKETHYVGYSPPILFDADRFFADFPAGQMVHIFRNPFSGYADTKRRPFPMGLAKYCQIWSHCQLAALTYQHKYRDRFHLVRFESLVDDPVGTLRVLTNSLGLEPFAGTPVPSFNRVPLKQVCPWGTIKHATPEANLATARELSKEERQAVQIECQPMLDSLGYGHFLSSL